MSARLLVVALALVGALVGCQTNDLIEYLGPTDAAVAGDAGPVGATRPDAPGDVGAVDGGVEAAAAEGDAAASADAFDGGGEWVCDLSAMAGGWPQPFCGSTGPVTCRKLSDPGCFPNGAVVCAQATAQAPELGDSGKDLDAGAPGCPVMEDAGAPPVSPCAASTMFPLVCFVWESDDGGNGGWFVGEVRQR